MSAKSNKSINSNKHDVNAGVGGRGGFMETINAMNDETVKKKVQIAVLSLTLNRSL